MSDYFGFERDLLLVVSPLLFFGGMFMLLLGFDFWFCFPAIVMAVVDLVVVRLIFPEKKSKKGGLRK